MVDFKNNSDEKWKAMSPSLKAHGIPGRARLFEVIQRVRAVNADRRHRAPRWQFTGKSANTLELQSNPTLELDYVILKLPTAVTSVLVLSVKSYLKMT